MNYFLDWLLFGFGHPGYDLPDEPSGCSGASMRLYQMFNLNLLTAYPHDYLGDILAINHFGKRSGFYPTPMPVCILMTQMLMHDVISGDLAEIPARGRHDSRLETVCDPCLGTGRLLLTASNYSLRLYGQDINDTVIKAALVNGYLYAPWLVKPLPFLDSELLYGDLAEIPARGRSASISDSMTATADQNSAAAEYLAETEHDAENQWKFEPIKKRKRKGQSDSEEVWQGSIF
jgi:hypothetical protein